MTLFEWKEEYSIGIVEIDKQHRKLVLLINKLFDAMRVGKGNAILGQIINDLVNYTETHFQDEERYFHKFNYGGIDDHKLKHKAFVDQIASFKSAFDSGKISLSLDVFNFLKSWLIYHILVEDKKYVDCFKQNGLK